MVLAASTVSASLDSAMKSGTANRGGVPTPPLLIVVETSLGCWGAAGCWAPGAAMISAAAAIANGAAKKVRFIVCTRR